MTHGAKAKRFKRRGSSISKGPASNGWNPQKKASRSKDRLEPEAYALAQDRTRLADQQAALASRLADVEAREEAILKAARIIEAARRAEGRPVAPDLVAIADRGRRRRDPDQSR